MNASQRSKSAPEPKRATPTMAGRTVTHLHGSCGPGERTATGRCAFRPAGGAAPRSVQRYACDLDLRHARLGQTPANEPFRARSHSWASRRERPIGLLGAFQAAGPAPGRRSADCGRGARKRVRANDLEPGIELRSGFASPRITRAAETGADEDPSRAPSPARIPTVPPTARRAARA